MAAPGIVPFDGGKSESDPKFSKVAVCDVVQSEASAEVVDSVGKCLRPGRFVYHDTTLNCSHPNANVEDRVVDFMVNQVKLGRCRHESTVSPINL